MVLNEINSIRIDNVPISVNIKQKLYKDLFENSRRKVTKKTSRLVLSNQLISENQEIRGVDEEIKSSLRSFHDFKQMLVNGILNEAQVEELILGYL